MATVLLLGVSRGTPWLFLALTTVTPGLLGLAWLAAIRRFVAPVRGLAVGAVVVGVSCRSNLTAWRSL